MGTACRRRSTRKAAAKGTARDRGLARFGLFGPAGPSGDTRERAQLPGSPQVDAIGTRLRVAGANEQVNQKKCASTNSRPRISGPLIVPKTPTGRTLVGSGDDAEQAAGGPRDTPSRSDA